MNKNYSVKIESRRVKVTRAVHDYLSALCVAASFSLVLLIFTTNLYFHLFSLVLITLVLGYVSSVSRKNIDLMQEYVRIRDVLYIFKVKVFYKNIRDLHIDKVDLRVNMYPYQITIGAASGSEAVIFCDKSKLPRVTGDVCYYRIFVDDVDDLYDELLKRCGDSALKKADE